jgi:hypothetical protein
MSDNIIAKLAAFQQRSSLFYLPKRNFRHRKVARISLGLKKKEGLAGL